MNTEESTDFVAFAHHIFDGQPFSQLIGAELVDVGPDSAEIRIQKRRELEQQHGFIHGGVLSYLADNALTFAGGLALGGDALTAGYTITYIRPAVGDVIIARAKTLEVTRRQAICQCLIYSSSNGIKKLVAVAQGTIATAAKGNDDIIK